MTKEDIEIFEKLKIQIVGLYEEISILSKKSPDKAVNKFKLNLINDIIKTANHFLQGKYKVFDDFNEFDLDELPTNSDIIFIVSQYIKCLQRFNQDNIGHKENNKYGEKYWIIDGNISNVVASSPGNFYVK